MNCAWQAYINLIPLRFRADIDKLGKDALQEVRLRIDRPPELILKQESVWLNNPVTESDLTFVVNIASQYSPWTAGSMRSGFITPQGGHRIGICGDVVMKDGGVFSMSQVTSVSVRVARDFRGVGERAKNIGGSVLIVGSPGRGKTTLLRDIVRYWSNYQKESVVVVDERSEVFPMNGRKFCFDPGMKTDILSGCSKKIGIEMVLRSMTPTVIAVDEITAREDCEGMIQAGWCGVRLLATAHAENRQELLTRPLYKPLLQSGLFQHLIVMHADKSWTLERLS